MTGKVNKFLVAFCLSLLAAVAADAQSDLVTARAAEKTVVLTGFTRARAVLTLATETSGIVENVFADVGDSIPDDGRFACLDETFIDLDIASNRAEIGRGRAEIDYFRKQVSRHRTLVNHNSSAQSQLDDAERNYAVARRQHQALDVENRRLKERKRRHCTRAPADWVVIERTVEPGQWLDIGQRIGTLGDFSRLLIPLALSMSEYRAIMRVADALTVRLPEIDATIPAQIERVSPAFEEQSRKIKLDLQVAKGIRQRRGGLRAELALTIPLQSGAVIVPRSALQVRYEEYWLLRSDGQEVKVVYLGKDGAQSGGDTGGVTVVSPDVHPGDQFRIRKGGK